MPELGKESGGGREGGKGCERTSFLAFLRMDFGPDQIPSSFEKGINVPLCIYPAPLELGSRSLPSRPREIGGAFQLSTHLGRSFFPLLFLKLTFDTFFYHRQHRYRPRVLYPQVQLQHDLPCLACELEVRLRFPLPPPPPSSPPLPSSTLIHSSMLLHSFPQDTTCLHDLA